MTDYNSGYSTPSIIAQYGELLRMDLPTETPAILLVHVKALLALRFELAGQTNRWLVIVHEARSKVLWPKDKDKTELDRKTYMDAAIAQLQADYDMLLKIDEIVKERLEFALLLLRV